MTETWCVGGKQKQKTNNFIDYEKVNPKTKKLVKVNKGTCSICVFVDETSHKFLLSK